MKHTLLKQQLLCGCMMIALSSQGMAQDTDTADEKEKVAVNFEEIVVTGQVVTRNRTASVAPELTYDTEFFQKFEPVSAGDMLKRTPGVAFTSDIGEYDAPQMRGMADGFTQVLVNGRPLPGAGNDRTVLVDRIPAEIIERIELIRSPGADIDSQGVGGTINIILKEGASIPAGGSVRASGIYVEADDKFRGAGAISYAGRSKDEDIFYSFTANVQQRFNAKKFIEEVISGEDHPNSVDGLDLFSPDDFDASVAEERAEQLDTRENLDISLNADVTFKVGDTGELRVDGFYIRTKRDEHEDVTAWERDDGVLVGDKVESQDTEIRQENFGFNALYEGELSDATKFDFSARYSQFDNVEDELNKEFDFDDPSEESLEDREREVINSLDKEFAADFGLEHAVDLMTLKFGGSTKFKKRNYSLLAQEADDFGNLEDDSFSEFDIKENRYDAYAVADFDFDGLTFEAGLRLEHTKTTIAAPGEADASNSVTLLNPSMHVQKDLGENGQLRLSVARTVRRPTFDQLVPVELSDEPDDDDITVGNPDLAMEKSWGFDVGYEYTLPGNGIMGLNLFYRKVSDLSQLVRLGDTEDGGGLYTYDNIGKGKTYGLEFDISTSLGLIGLEETGFFANYTRLWSSRYDEFLQQNVNFNHQPKYVYNFGMTQNFPSIEATTGFSYQKQGLAQSVFYAEIEDQYYGANLEFFIEKRFESGLILRFTANNLLNADSIQGERNYGSLDDMRADVDAEFEVERETASRVFQLTARYSF